MPPWLVTHIDAIIPMVIGAVVLLQALFKRESSTMDAAKRRKVLLLVGAAMIVIGVSRILTGTVAPN